MRIAVPSVLVIAVVGAWTDGLGWRQALLLNGLSHREWSEPQWYYWFVEAIVYILLVTAALIAIPAVDRWERRHSFGVPFSLAVAALLTRYGVVGAVDNGDHIHRAHVVFWLFALGWAAARAERPAQRWLLTALVLGSVPGFFDEGVRNAYVAAGLILLIWARSLPIPRWAAAPLSVLAAASLWIYLLHWQVYPHWEYSVPWFATLASLAVGVAGWWLAGALQRALSRTVGVGSESIDGGRGNKWRPREVVAQQ